MTMEEKIYIRLITGVQEKIWQEEASCKIKISDQNRQEWADQAAALARFYARAWEETKPSI